MSILNRVKDALERNPRVIILRKRDPIPSSFIKLRDDIYTVEYAVAPKGGPYTERKFQQFIRGDLIPPGAKADRTDYTLHEGRGGERCLLRFVEQIGEGRIIREETISNPELGKQYGFGAKQTTIEERVRLFGGISIMVFPSATVYELYHKGEWRVGRIPKQIEEELWRCYNEK